MIQLSIPRRIVRAIHAGIAGVLFLLILVALAGDELLRDDLLQKNWGQVNFLGYWLACALAFLAVALLIKNAAPWALVVMMLFDAPMIWFFWDSVKGLLLAPVLAVSILCFLIELFRQFSLRKRLAT